MFNEPNRVERVERTLYFLCFEREKDVDDDRAHTLNKRSSALALFVRSVNELLKLSLKVEKSRVCYMEENGIRTCERCRGSSSGVDLRPNDEVLCTVCWIDSLSSRQDNTSNQFLAGSEDQPKTVNIGEAEPEKANSEPTRSKYENQVEVSSSMFNNKDKKDFGTNDISSNDSFDFNTSTSTDLSNHSGQESKN